MRRGIAVPLVGLLALAGGCASPARYVEQQPDSGVVAIPTNRGILGGFNEREAVKLIEEHVGPDYEIIKKGEVVTGQATATNQQTNTQQVANRKNPNMPGEQQVAASTTTTQDIKEYRIWYRRKAAPMPGGNGGAPPVVQTGGVQQQGAPPGVLPSVMPGNGVPARGPTGPMSYFVPGSRPAAGAACSS